jgi:hypothetical protein
LFDCLQFGVVLLNNTSDQIEEKLLFARRQSFRIIRIHLNDDGDKIEDTRTARIGRQSFVVLVDEVAIGLW